MWFNPDDLATVVLDPTALDSQFMDFTVLPSEGGMDHQTLLGQTSNPTSKDRHLLLDRTPYYWLEQGADEMEAPGRGRQKEPNWGPITGRGEDSTGDQKLPSASSFLYLPNFSSLLFSTK